jgi:hypothetical protein
MTILSVVIIDITTTNTATIATATTTSVPPLMHPPLKLLILSRVRQQRLAVVVCPNRTLQYQQYMRLLLVLQQGRLQVHVAQVQEHVNHTAVLDILVLVKVRADLFAAVSHAQVFNVVNSQDAGDLSVNKSGRDGNTV